MATSGRIETSRANNTNFYVQWQLAGQSVGGNYSDVNWQAGINMSANTYWYSNSIRIDDGHVNGAGIGNGTWSNINGTGDKQLRSGTVRIYHNGDGTKNFGAYINGWLYANGNRTASGSWDLPNIPRHAVLNSAPNFNDTSNPTINYSNPAGTAVDAFLETAGYSGAVAPRNLGSGGGGNYTFTLTEAERDTLRARTPNSTTRTVRFVIHDRLGGSDSWSWIDRTLTIVDGEPVFSDFTYKDNTPATVTVTGNDQILVQGKSTLRATVSTANKMVAQKSATEVSYTASFDGSVDTEPYSASAAVDLDIATVAGAGVKTLTVRATDSRGKQTAVNKDITVVPYDPPVLNIEAARLNNFENATTLKIGGTFSRLTIGGTDKNAITTGTLQYRTRQDGGAWNSWVTKAFTAGVGTFSTVDTNLSLVNSSAWDIEVKVSDKLETTTASVSVGRGIPLMHISDNLEAVGINRMPTAGRALDVTGKIFSNDKEVAPLENIYKFKAHRTTSQSFGDGVRTTAVFNTELFDTNNNYDPATGIYTVPVTGYYQVSVKTRLEITGSGSVSNRWLWEANVRLIQNSTTIDEDKMYTYADGRVSSYDAKLNDIYFLTQGDTLRAHIFADTSDSTAYIFGGAREQSSFSARLVSI